MIRLVDLILEQMDGKIQGVANAVGVSLDDKQRVIARNDSLLLGNGLPQELWYRKHAAMGQAVVVTHLTANPVGNAPVYLVDR